MSDTYVAMTLHPGNYYYIDDGTSTGTKDDKLTFTLQHAQPTMGVDSPAQRAVDNSWDDTNNPWSRYIRVTFGRNPVASRYAIPNGTQESFRIALPASATCANRAVSLASTITITDTPSVVTTFLSVAKQPILLQQYRNINTTNTFHTLTETDVRCSSYSLTVMLKGDAFDMNETEAEFINSKIRTDTAKAARSLVHPFLTNAFLRAPLGLNPEITEQDKDVKSWDMRVPNMINRLEESFVFHVILR